MKEHPIIMTGESVRAIIAGRKTQTRRIVKLPAGVEYDGHSPETFDVSASAQHQPTGSVRVRNPYGVQGDTLWVKETFAYRDREFHPEGGYWYAATDDYEGKSVSPLFMPRAASRITLRVTSVRVERVQAISEADAKAEGCDSDADIAARLHRGAMLPSRLRMARDEFRDLWDRINAKRASWASNPWVWAVAFEVVR